MMQHTPDALHDKTALITGASKRIGAAITRCLHQAGMRVLIHCHQSLAQAEELAQQLNTLRAESAAVLQADLLAENSESQLINDAIKQWGRLDLLVNNASSYYPTPIADISQQAWLDLLGTNLKAPLFLSQAAAVELKKNRGSIINLVDLYAQRPLANYSVYCAAKAGLIAVTKSLAAELGPEIRVNGIAPGHILPASGSAAKSSAAEQLLIETTALRRSGKPQDIAQTVLFLVRDAEFISGEIIHVDGGRY